MMHFLRHAWQVKLGATAPFGPCATSFEAGYLFPIPSFYKLKLETQLLKAALRR